MSDTPTSFTRRRAGGSTSRRGRLAVTAVLLLALTGLGADAGAQNAAECERWRAAFTSMPMRMVTIERSGRMVAFRVKIAENSEQQAGGFQCATPEEIARYVIVFDFGREIMTQFHMQNVPAPLDIAFVKADGRILSVLRMDPSPTALYGPMGSFRYAIEARAGFFESQGIKQGEARLMPSPSR